MSDPVAEAAAQLAAQKAAEPSLLEKALDTIHELEAKVEHLIHPDAPGNVPAVAEVSATAPVTAELPNVVAGTPPAGAAMPASTEGELPNAASAVAAPTAEPVSAPSAGGANTTLPTAASSVERALLPTRIAVHLEAIYKLAKDHVESAPAAAVSDASALKTHVGDVLHHIYNGMQVSEGALVAKLEKLYHML
jgi:hypothetical protein